MNKIVSINLGGYPFTIDEDAFELLNNYMESIRKHFKDSEGCNEIVADIEARIAELCQESLDGNQILSIQHVEKAIKTMGRPEEFGTESEAETSDSTKSGKSKSQNKFGIKTGKRLFRNMDDKVIGGVCSGLAAYFGIQDPTWVRVFVAIAFFAGGVGVLPYLVLWVVIPEAKTAADKLAMRGEPINASNIAKTVQEEFEHLTQKITEFGEGLNDKYKFGKKKNPSNKSPEGEPESDDQKEDTSKKAFYSSNQDFMHKGIDAAKEISEGISRFFRGTGKTILFVVISILIFGVAVSWIAMIASFGFLYPYESFFLDSPVLSFFGLISGLLFIGLPVLGILFLVMRIAFRTRFSAGWGIGLSILWFVSLFMLGSLAGRTAHDFNESASVQYESPQPWAMLSSDTLKISSSKQNNANALADLGDIQLTDGKLFSEDIRLSVVRAEGPNFVLKEKRSARGKDQRQAENNAKNPDFEAVIKGNELLLDGTFSLKKGEKWRIQQIKLELEVPVGKSLVLDRKTAYRLNNFEAKDSWSHWKTADKVWTMTEDGLVCQNCEEEE